MFEESARQVAATREDISSWFDEGVRKGHCWMIVLCDTFDWSDYPSYYDCEHAARHRMNHPPAMATVMECYDLRADKDTQMKQHRAMGLSV
jgi:hypothetical protein